MPGTVLAKLAQGERKEARVFEFERNVTGMFEFRFDPRTQLPPGGEFLIAFGRTYSLASFFLLGFAYLLEEPSEGWLYLVYWGVGIALAILVLLMFLKPFAGMLLNIYIAKRTRRQHLGIEVNDEGLSVMYGGNVALTVPLEDIYECVYRRFAGHSPASNNVCPL